MGSTLTEHITNKQLVAGSSLANGEFNIELFPGMARSLEQLGARINGFVPYKQIHPEVGGVGRGAAHS